MMSVFGSRVPRIFTLCFAPPRFRTRQRLQGPKKRSPFPSSCNLLFVPVCARHAHAAPLSLQLNSMLCFLSCERLTLKGASAMEWVTPQHEEIDLNCEVSSYANAEL